MCFVSTVRYSVNKDKDTISYQITCNSIYRALGVTLFHVTISPAVFWNSNVIYFTLVCPLNADLHTYRLAFFQNIFQWWINRPTPSKFCRASAWKFPSRIAGFSDNEIEGVKSSKTVNKILVTFLGRNAMLYSCTDLQIENKSQEIIHHLGTQKDAKLCLKCTNLSK